MRRLPIRVWNEHTIPELVASILEFVEKDGVIAFCIRYVSTYNAMTATRDCDDAVLLFESSVRGTGILVKNSLIKAFFDHPRCRNDILETLRATEQEGTICVYIAIWYGCGCTNQDKRSIL